MQAHPFSQTFIGAVLVAALGGIIVVLIQKGFLDGNQPPRPLPENSPVRAPPPQTPVPEASSPQNHRPPNPLPRDPLPRNTNNWVESIDGPIGVPKTQISQCVQRNSTKYVVGRDYRLDDGLYGEAIIKLYVNDESLKTLIFACMKPR
jgi:hypothetical protein